MSSVLNGLGYRRLDPSDTISPYRPFPCPDSPSSGPGSDRDGYEEYLLSPVCLRGLGETQSQRGTRIPDYPVTGKSTEVLIFKSSGDLDTIPLHGYVYVRGPLRSIGPLKLP